jgi:hypothetical protein
MIDESTQSTQQIVNPSSLQWAHLEGVLLKSERNEYDLIRERVTCENSKDIAGLDIAAPEAGALRHLGNPPSTWARLQLRRCLCFDLELNTMRY